MTVGNRIKECTECGGVMKSVWSDGKTRTHAMRCLRCDHERDLHQNRTTYIEVRHADLFDSLDVELDYDEFVAAADDLRLKSTQEAFHSEDLWQAVKVRLNDDGKYTVAAYRNIVDPGTGIGPNGMMPHGQPDVAWTTDAVYLDGSKIRIAPMNGGTAYTYFCDISEVKIDAADQFISLRP